jgi:CBS domain-containing protein
MSGKSIDLAQHVRVTGWEPPVLHRSAERCGTSAAPRTWDAEVDMKVRASFPDAVAKTAASVMTPEPVVIGPGDLLQDAVERMARFDIRHLPVVTEEGEVIGMLSDRDLRIAMKSIAVARVSSAMTPMPMAVPPTAPLHEVALALADERIGALPVVDEGRLVGIVSHVDLLYSWPECEGPEEGVSVELRVALDDARFLLAQLERHAIAVEDELVHTDHRSLQRELADDARRIRRIAKDLERLLRAMPQPPKAE